VVLVRVMSPLLPVCLPLFPPSTTNRSFWKNWETMVCLCGGVSTRPSCSSVPPSQLCSAPAVSWHPQYLGVCRFAGFARVYHCSHSRESGEAVSSGGEESTQRTCNILNSFCPLVKSSLMRSTSETFWCSLNASRVLRFAYSRKL
jgi:hypothetical protein